MAEYSSNESNIAPLVRSVGGRYLIEWPSPRPDSFSISSELFEALVEQLNDARNVVDEVAAIRREVGELLRLLGGRRG
jgi:hypothetical protein